mmetsp:Transcript_1157/g.3738  ORF Transcript_1157/g.3738 Transcript_1157/m.3738 type:complete len:280 (-) Transcript_1157:163-1002(-)
MPPCAHLAAPPPPARGFLPNGARSAAHAPASAAAATAHARGLTRFATTVITSTDATTSAASSSAAASDGGSSSCVDRSVPRAPPSSLGLSAPIAALGLGVAPLFPLSALLHFDLTCAALPALAPAAAGVASVSAAKPAVSAVGTGGSSASARCSSTTLDERDRRGVVSAVVTVPSAATSRDTSTSLSSSSSVFVDDVPACMSAGRSRTRSITAACTRGSLARSLPSARTERVVASSTAGATHPLPSSRSSYALPPASNSKLFAPISRLTSSTSASEMSS